MRCGADTGGTFTDLVTDDGRTAKVPSTPDEPGRALGDGLTQLVGPGTSRPSLLTHGTTVATNALLERRGATVALVTTRGFADVVEIARQDRPSLYDLRADRPVPLVPRHLRFEVAGRLDARGREVQPLDVVVPPIDQQTAAVAVCLLHSDLNPAHEHAVSEALAARGLDVTCSSDVSPEFREYERTLTTLLNAYLRPVCRPYLRSLEHLADEVLVMTSAGGLVPVGTAADLPVSLLLSGPAAGVRAGAAVAAGSGFPDAVTFDMGGTSTDVCLVMGGVPEPSPERRVGGLPVRMPSLDIHTIGAGGGSIAGLDPGGALVVGPRSAGAWPGPACYGRGGKVPTVTDADLVLGHIPRSAVFPGMGTLEYEAAEGALAGAGVDAGGVVEVVDAAMQEAVRAVTVARGVDPRDLALVAFGGAGPLHACAVADALGMAAVVVPQRAGVLSALGLLSSPPQRDLVRSWPEPLSDEGLNAARAALAEEARAAVAGEHGAAADGDIEVTTALDCRYAGQSHELTVSDVLAFGEEHRRRNGYVRPGAPVEVTALRARARRPPPLRVEEMAPATDRSSADGPTALCEPDCTVWVPDGWRADVADDGSWVLRPRRRSPNWRPSRRPGP